MTDRIAKLVDDERVFVPVPDPSLRRHAHVTGNQVDVFHCPFCGSGAVVARSDMSIECSFCNSAFTVTISPMYPAFPMSMDGGQPYPWPGRPQDGMDPAMGGDPNAAGGGFGGQLIPGGGAGGDPGADGDGDDNPFAEGGGDADDEGDAPPDGDGQDTEAEVGGSKKPPFGKKKSSRQFRTVTGAVLPVEDYMRHLALATAEDPNALAAKIRQERRG